MRNVRGVLFADYVRMIRANKNVDWARRLTAEDLPYLEQRIDSDAWYPMAAFERLGDAILAEIAGGRVEAARPWGKLSVDALCAAHPSLLAPGDPVETLYRFGVLRSTFFDFDALEVLGCSEGRADVVIRFHMGDPAEEAASHQTVGFFERLLEIAGAKDVKADFAERAWAGDPRTLLELRW